MNLVCSIDNNYVRHCCVMLSSFFENNPEEGHAIYLLTEGLTKENRKIIEELVNAYKGTFHYCLIDPQFVTSCPISEEDHLTIATYYRLLMAEVLPRNIDKILYLDCDIVINDSITELWNTSLDGYALAAVEELGCSLPDVYERLEYDKQYGYFNAGVLLVNLHYWRKHGLTNVFLEYMALYRERLKAHDQDVLNALLHKHCLHISFEWNVEEAFYHYKFIKRLRFDCKLRSVLCCPKILHYTWKPKPWDNLCKHPFRINYYIYLWKIKGAVEKSHLSLMQKFLGFKDRYIFCLFLRLGFKGHCFYKL